MILTQIEVSQDKMLATIPFLKVKHDDGSEVNYSEISQLLKEYQISFGFDADQLRKTIEDHIREQKPLKDFILAKGQAPTAGVDARLDWQLPEKKEVTEDENTNRDHRETYKYICVSKEQKVALYTKAKPGKNGCTVLGESLPAPTTQKLDVAFSSDFKGEDINEDQVQYTATKDGLLIVLNGEYKLLDNLELKGSVDLSTGHIRATVPIQIAGDIKSGFLVQSTKKIEIKGMIEDGARVISGDDLEFTSGILGSKTYIESEGNISAPFINDATVFCHKNLTVLKYIYHANIRCLDTIEVQGQGLKNNKSSVVGGKLVTKKCMNLHSAGAPGSANTILVCGVDLENKEKMKNMKEQIQENEARIQRLGRHFDFDLNSSAATEQLKKLKGNERKKAIDILRRLKSEVGENQGLKKESKTIEKDMFPVEDGAVINIANQIYATIDIYLANGDYHVKLDSKAMSFTFDPEAYKVITQAYKAPAKE